MQSDIYDGKALTVWQEDETVYVTMCNVTIAIPDEHWDLLKNDMQILGTIEKSVSRIIASSQ